MKIITNNAVYVQKKDILYLLKNNLPLPKQLFKNEKSIFIIDDANKYDFVKFENPNIINFFRNLDWIIDYNSVKDLSYFKILELGENINQKRNQLTMQFNSLSKEDRKSHLDIMDECKLLDFKIEGLRDFLWFKQGYLQMNLPENNDYSQKPKKSIKQLIKKLFIKY